MFDAVVGNTPNTETVQRGLTELWSRRLAPNSDWSDSGSCEHFVQFYEADAFLVNSVAEYLIHGIRSGETCIVAATADHSRSIETVIARFGIDIKRAKETGKYIRLDASRTLAKFMSGGMPDADLFSRVIGSVIKKESGRSKGIRIFGEMVSILCTEGNYSAAIGLEDLWNGLRKEYPFSLFCGYHLSGIGHDEDDRMRAICSTHARVIPAESYTALTSSHERLQMIAKLQQRNVQLEAELAAMQQRL